MLELDIVKVHHGSEKYAKVLLDHIRNCDIYSSENSALEETDAENLEMRLNDLISSDISRSKFMRGLENGVFKGADPTKIEFLLKEFQYLFQSKPKLWYAERFSPNDAKNVMDLKSQSDAKKSKAGREIYGGDMGAYFESITASYKLLDAACTLRNMNLGRNIDEAKDQLREKHADLRDKETLNLVVRIGYGHNPENYTSVTARVHEYIPTPTNFWDVFLVGHYHEGRSYDELRSILLRAGASYVSGHTKHPFNASNKELREMSDEQIVFSLKNLKPPYAI
jgi:hypothetical protein